MEESATGGARRKLVRIALVVALIYVAFAITVTIMGLDQGLRGAARAMIGAGQ